MRTLASSRAVFAAGLSLILLASLPAGAQKAPEVGKADALFNAGRSLLEAGEYAEACPRFAESQSLAPGLGVTLYLADCYEHLGRTASALIEFKRAVQIASARGDKRAAVAAERAASLEGRVPLLVIAVTPAARAQGVTVARDNEPVPASQWDTPVQVDPGVHEITASAPSKVSSHTSIELGPRKTTITTTVDALQSPEDLAASHPAPAQTVVAAPVSTTRKWVGLVVGGAGVLGVGVGAVLGVLAISKLHQSNDGPCNAMDFCNTAGLGLRSQAEGFGNASTVAFIAGGVAVAGGAVLYLTAPRAPTGREGGVAFTPIFGPGVLGLNVRSSF
jgi:hypothetical protein